MTAGILVYRVLDNISDFARQVNAVKDGDDHGDSKD